MGDWEWELIMLAYFHSCLEQENKQLKIMHTFCLAPMDMYALGTHTVVYTMHTVYSVVRFGACKGSSGYEACKAV